MSIAAWRHIARVSKATFHWFNGYVTKGLQTKPYGNSTLFKPRKHSSQAIATLRCMLENSGDDTECKH